MTTNVEDGVNYTGKLKEEVEKGVEGEQVKKTVKKKR